ncbi:hypothetical protein OH76DRAFT_1412384 [Lentinus brumalis]|uniref:Uncharacterized protein n=1 Tax=Lentinus brumalis TaxID=2498619 RepID=A0A371CLC6_9APHY|nr:hypothetical protein OH76DRAFT_1412384 [Polyporus brumalis]
MQFLLVVRASRSGADPGQDPTGSAGIGALLQLPLAHTLESALRWDGSEQTRRRAGHTT